jgi:hypothetical protein
MIEEKFIKNSLENVGIKNLSLTKTPDDEYSIHVHGIPKGWTETDLHDAFVQFGGNCAKIERNKKNRDLLNHGFVNFKSVEVEEKIKPFQGKIVC